MVKTEPYYAVIFTSKRTTENNGYSHMAELMYTLAQQQKGFLGFESAREQIGISVSYWESLEAISAWKANIDHQLAQEQGKNNWYSWYKVRVCLVEREYAFFNE